MRRNYKLFFGISVIGVALLVLVFLRNPVDATNAPTIVSYQGKLLESGASVTTTKAMSFLLYDALTAGNLLYTASGTLSSTSTISKTPENGIFTVQLGGSGTNSLDPALFQNNSAIYLEVWVAGQKLTPRKQITTAPYAFNSQYLMGFSATTTSSTVYIPVSDSYGNFTFTGTASTTGVNGGIIYINPASAGANMTLFGIGDNGTERFKVDKEGDAWVFGALNVSSTFNVVANSTLATTTIVSSTITTANISNLTVGTAITLPGNSITDAMVVDSITATNYLPLAGGTLTGLTNLWGGAFINTSTIGNLTVSSTLDITNSTISGLSTADLSDAATLTTLTGNNTLSGNNTFTGLNTFTATTTFATTTMSSSSITVANVGSLNVNGNSVVGNVSSTNVSISNYLNVLGQSTFLNVSSTNIDNTGYLNVDSGTFYVDNVNNRVGINSSTPGYSLSVSGMSYFSGTSTITDLLDLQGKVSNPTLLASYTTTSISAVDVVKTGNYAYVADDSYGLRIIDVTTPSNPINVSNVSVPGAKSVFVSGDYVYVIGVGPNVLKVFDVSSRVNPQLVGTLTFAFTPGRMFVSGNYAYVAAGTTGFAVVDISHQGRPQLVTTLAPPLNVTSVFVYGEFAYLTDVSAGFVVVDISKPRIPVMRDSYPSANFGSMFVSGKHAYVSESSDIRILDISNADDVTSVGIFTTTDAKGVFVSGNYAYIADGSAGLKVADISSSTLPFQKGSLSTTNATRVFVSGNYAYIADGTGGLRIVDVSGATISQAEIGTVKATNLEVLNNASFNQSMSVRGGLSIGSNGLLLSGDIAMSSPTSTEITNATNTISFSHTALFSSNVTTTDEAAFVFDTVNTLGSSGSLLNIRNNGSLRMLLNGDGNLGINTSSVNYKLVVDGNSYFAATTTMASGMIVDGGTLFVDAANNRVGINTLTPGSTLDVNGAATFQATTTVNSRLIVVPTLTGLVPYISLDTAGTAKDVYVSDDYAYIADGTSGLQIIDISNQNLPNIVGTVGGFTANSVHISGQFAYVGTSAGMKIIDISNPSIPTIVGSYTNLNTTDLYVSGNYAFLTISAVGVVVVDVSNPFIPRLATTYTPTAFAAAIEIFGNYAYVIDGADGMYILDISDPYNIRTMGLYSTGATAYDVKVRGKYAYVAGGTGNSLKIIDISTSTAPVLEGSLAITGVGNRIFVSGNYAYLTPVTNQGIRIADITNPSAPTLAKEYNTSMNAYATFVSGNILYVADGTSGLTLFDLQGSKLNSLQTGSFRADGIDISGAAKFNEMVYAKSGLIIGANGLLMAGDFSMNYPTSTHITTATNTLNFSHTALFKSTATATESNLFIFDTVNAFSTTASTTYLLSVRNNGTPEFSVASNGDVTARGNFFANSATIGAPFTPGDLAERVDINPTENVEPGDVMVVDSDSTDTYRRSATAYDNRVAGVISTQPSIIVGDARTQYTAVMAMVGRVPVKSSTENGSIMRGDLLVSASTPGYAMKYDPAKDDEGRVVGIIGVALDSLTTSTGKIMALVRTGWVQNRNQTLQTMQDNISSIATATNVAIQNNPQQLTIEQNTSGQISYSAGQNLDMNNSLIINVAGIAGANGRWQIDEEGRFITKVAGANGNSRSLYALQSEQTDMIISGTSALENGVKKIEFDELNSAIINPEKNIKVSITLTAEANGVFVTDKNEKGFTVKELNNGKSNATFDWVVIAERRIGDIPNTAETPASTSDAGSPTTPTTDNNQPPTSTVETATSTSGAPAVETSNPPPNPPPVEPSPVTSEDNPAQPNPDSENKAEPATSNEPIVPPPTDSAPSTEPQPAPEAPAPADAPAPSQ